ncbi:MAG: rRNA maturation RNase YbeY [Bacteroidota bacterium]
MNKIEVFYEEVDFFAIDVQMLEQHAEFLVKNEKRKLGDVSIIFCSDEYLLRINEEYLNHNYYTDIITFDYTENFFISGDLFISLDRIRDNALKFQTTFYKELYRVILHGLLHLVGYRDKTDVEQEKMREKEDFYLEGIDFDRGGI